MMLVTPCKPLPGISVPKITASHIRYIKRGIPDPAKIATSTCACVCARVCVRETETEKKRERGGKKKGKKNPNAEYEKKYVYDLASLYKETCLGEPR